MSANLYICKGCCCGRIEKGNSEVPVEMLKSAWQEHELSDSVRLNITSCLGPCSMNNVVLFKSDSKSIWLGKLNEMVHYENIIEWIKEIKENDNSVTLPKYLESQKFTPTSL